LSFLGLLFACAQPGRGALFTDQVLSDNPQGFWMLNDAGPTAVDSSPNHLDGTYRPGVTPQGIAGPSWVPSPGLVANFTGGTTSFQNPLNLGANGYTIEAWINPTLASLQNPSRIVASGRGNDGYSFGTTTDGQLILTLFRVQDYVTTLGPLQRLLPNQWQYVGVVLDANNNANFYVNGSLVQTVASTGFLGTIAPTENLTFGGNSPGPGIVFPDEIYTGGLAGISVYNTALTSGQISAQYLAAVPEPASCSLVAVLVIFAAVVVRRIAGDGSPDTY
jgi:hypothetical protein